MAVTVVAVVMALVLCHVAPALVTSARQFPWLGHWLQWLGTQSGEGGFWRGRHGIVLALLPVLAGVALLQWLLHAPLLGFLGLLFGVVALVYAWGPRDLDVDVEAIIDAHDAPTRRAAIARLGLTGEAAALDGPALVEAVFANAWRRWFGVLFWFLLLGPVGALLYRLSALAVDGESATGLPEQTRVGARALVTALGG